MLFSVETPARAAGRGLPFASVAATVLGLIAPALPVTAAPLTVTGLGITEFNHASQLRTPVFDVPPDPPGPYNVTYDGVERRVTSVSIAADVYVPIQTGTVAVRRNTATSTFPNTNANQTTAYNTIVSIGGTGGVDHTVRGRYFNTMEALLGSNNVQTGTENLFVNVGAAGAASSNIERVDFLIGGTTGFTAAAGQGFMVLERGRGGAGGGGVNGGFRIAAVTAVDGSGTPTDFGTVVTIADDSYSNSNNGVGIGTTNYDVFRYLTAGGPELDHLENVNIGPQGVAGVLVPVSDLVSLGTTVYGYAVFGLDVTGTGTQLADWTNATFYPTLSNTDNDVDMVASGAVLLQLVPEPAAAALYAAGAAAGLLGWMTRRTRLRPSAPAVAATPTEPPPSADPREMH